MGYLVVQETKSCADMEGDLRCLMDLHWIHARKEDKMLERFGIANADLRRTKTTAKAASEIWRHLFPNPRHKNPRG